MYKESHHAGLGAMPSFINTDSKTSVSKLCSESDTGMREDGNKWKRKTYKFAQYVFSRVQHHYHKRGPKGVRVPLTACKRKGKKTSVSMVSPWRNKSPIA